MKRVGGLFDAIVDRANLAAAAWAAARGKQDRPAVRAFFTRFDEEIGAMRTELAAGTWRFAPYRRFTVRDTKTRTIHAPAFRDRVVHHAIVGVAGPVLESGALFHSYACRRGKGQHAALAVARKWSRRTDWYGKLDVDKFYDTVDHVVLRRLLDRRFRERRLLQLFDALLDSYATAPGKGLPIGALTSQYLGNFYLDEVDRHIKATGAAHRYLRYMDDMVVWGDPVSLAIVRAAALEGMAEVQLRPKHGGEWNRCAQGLPFLGFVIYPGRLRVNRQGRRRLRRKLGGIERAYRDGMLDECSLQKRGASLFAHVATADDSAWRRAVLLVNRGRDDEGEALEPRPRGPRRLLEQHGPELPLRVSQQEEARQPQRQPGFPGLSGSRHEDDGEFPVSPDDVPSRSRPADGLDEASGKSPAGVDIRCRQEPNRTMENTSAGAPLDARCSS